MAGGVVKKHFIECQPYPMGAIVRPHEKLLQHGPSIAEHHQRQGADELTAGIDGHPEIATSGHVGSGDVAEVGLFGQ